MTNHSCVRLAVTVLFVFAMVLGAAASAQALSKAEMQDLSQQLKVLKADLKEVQQELRKINEEGSEADQARAQELMDKSVQLRERIRDIEDKLQSAQPAN